ncbi:thrombospondin type 3 repeat-containing protein [Chryseobacterium sp. MEBOG07]|uniref:thrombospondin type 3 repeat-containing protein n=1 Tax=Chryseobacterium sp. MEBOG07 TaxID=2879939 RepID=UPI001F45394D|nr:thrombospondin type 3 repeat-containing protein [Chryseobacterium sp. MEBOG07]UKB81547.1 thrombospondin type 3 repeat-containing protein [Chryseobacterium sp. MEBOG07]
MKIFYFTILILSFSCSKSNEDNCFVDKINDTDDVIVFEIKKPYTVRQILAEKPAYLDIINLKKYRKFKKDRVESHSYIQGFEENITKNEDSFKILNEKFFDQFYFLAKQKIGNTLYGLGKNNLGFWLLKIENSIPKAYFLGLSTNHYYFNRTQENPIIQGDYLQVEGGLVKTVEVGGRPGYTDYSAMEDGKLFKIKLKDLIEDTDNDGYNDVFEKSFGLNPDNKDSDGDGIDDFEDMNPMFKSEKNKFTELYELLLPYYGNANLKNRHYTFQVYKIIVIIFTRSIQRSEFYLCLKKRIIKPTIPKLQILWIKKFPKYRKIKIIRTVSIYIKLETALKMIMLQIMKKENGYSKL